jgi:choice-of-anchor B domain-containing protein
LLNNATFNVNQIPNLKLTKYFIMKKNVLHAILMLLSMSAMAQNNYNMKFRSHTEFPGQTLANICGYAQDGREYALLGASKGMIIMDVTNPDAAKQIIQIPGPDNLWKEIKVYKNYAYVTSEGGQGLQIVDMSGLPDAAKVTNTFYTGDGVIEGRLNRIHALHIDVPKGVVYCFGATGVASGGAIMLDIKTDPLNPKYLGAVTKDYIHDGYAENDTLYAGHIYRGEMEVWNTKDKKNPVSLGVVKTPTKFTHNIWLSDNHKYAFTTDENNNSFLGAYDITDLSNIQLVDKISHNIGSGAVIHNTHILNSYAVSSYYTEGVTIHDVHRPDNLVEVAHYDTYSPAINPADPFEGAWGVYPFLPSGNLIISNIDEGLYIVSPTYKRACYLEGVVKNKVNKDPISGAVLMIQDVATANASSDFKGIYKTGVANEGTITVTISKPGFASKTVTAAVTHGNVTNLDIELEPLTSFNVIVQVKDEFGNTIEGAKVGFSSRTQNKIINSNSDGIVTFASYNDTLAIYAGKWGYNIGSIKEYIVSTEGQKTITLKKGYKDDFISTLKFDWKTATTATTGDWVLETPIGTTNGGAATTPSVDDIADLGRDCYLTGNAAGAPGNSDVDNGSVTLTSPSMDLTTYKNPVLKYDEWFYNGGGAGTIINDSLTVTLDNGIEEKIIHVAKGDKLNKWTKITLPLKSVLTLTKNMKVSFKAADEDPGHLVKAAIDVFEITESVDVSDYIDENFKISAAPNPSNSSFAITYDIPVTSGEMTLSNAQGQIIERINLSSPSANIIIGQNLSAGIYFLQIQSGEKMSRPMRLVKF